MDATKQEHGSSVVAQDGEGQAEEVEPRLAAHALARFARQYSAEFGQALNSDSTLRTAVSAALQTSTISGLFGELDLSPLLTVQHAAETFRAAYGYSAWIVAPELGVRALLRECLQPCEGPMQQTLEAVHAALLSAAALVHARVAAGSELGVESLQDLEARAQAAIVGWRDETRAQLQRLLAAEAGFPDAAAFAALRLELSGQWSGPPESACALVAQPGSGDEVLGKPEDETWHRFFMGWLSKRNRHGRWQRRWFVVAPSERRLYYFSGPEQAAARATIPLAGAAVITDVLPLASSFKALKALQSGGAVESAAQQHVFQLQLEAEVADPAAGGGPALKRAVASITLRADSAASKRQWVEQLAAAIQGGAPAAAGVKTLPELPGQGSEGGEAGSPVQRKISSVVYPDSDAPRHSAEDAEAAADALVAAIAAQAAQAPISAQEAAVLERVVAAVRGYVRDGQARLADLTGKVVAAGCLGRGDELFHALLAALAPAYQRSALEWA